jgi:hypothetical protein
MSELLPGIMPSTMADGQKKGPLEAGLFCPANFRVSSYSKLAPPQFVLPLVAFHVPAGVVALVQAG